MLTRAEFSALALAAQRDPEPLIARAFWLTTKMLPGQPPITRFVLNTAQRKIHQAVLVSREIGRPPRVVCLKARQPGASSLGLAYLLSTALCFPYSQSMLIAHLDDAAARLFKRLKFMRDRLPDGLRPGILAERRKEIIFDGIECLDGNIQLNTMIAVETAGGGEPWRSTTLQCVHLSEFAQMDYGSNILLGVLQSVPPTPQSLVLVESTAQGLDSDFHTLYQSAVAGDSDFTPVFIPWHDIPEYRMTPGVDFELELEEVELKKAFALDDEQIQWRRYTLRTQCQGDPDRFAQEFPATAHEAFLASGRPAFNIKRLQMLWEPAREAPRKEGLLIEDTGLPKFTELRGGGWTIYKFPVEGHEYCIGGDPSAGVEGGDPGCIQVFDRTTGEQVAIWHGLLNPVPFAAEMLKAGVFYHQAILAPEVNGGYGLTVVAELRAAQYLRLYVWQRLDRIRNTWTNYYGWWTTHHTRPVMIDTFAYAINEGEVKIWDLGTINEALAFQYVEGRAAGQGSTDDRIVALMIAYRVHLEMPLESTGAPPRAKYGDPSAPAGEALPPLPTGFSREAWEETDEELKRMKGDGKNTANDYGVPDPEPGEDPSFYPDPAWPY